MRTREAVLAAFSWRKMAEGLMREATGGAEVEGGAGDGGGAAAPPLPKKSAAKKSKSKQKKKV